MKHISSIPKNFLLSFALCLLSSLLLILAFPKFDLWLTAWFGLVPLLGVLDGKTAKQGFLWGYVCGLVFFLGCFYWVIHIKSSAGIPLPLAIVAVLLLNMYLALYFGLFGWLYVLFQKQPRVYKFILYPSIWVVLEFLRDHLFSGLGWMRLGHSQYQVLPMIQIAEWTGIVGISFLIVMANYVVKEFCRGCFQKGWRETFIGMRWVMAATGFILLLNIVFGYQRLHQPSDNARSVKIAVIQGNVSQETKWYAPAWPLIMEKYLHLTKEAAGAQPDLIVWPETSFPGYPWELTNPFQKITGLAADIKIPILFGTVTKEGESYYNSAILVSKEGTIVKQHNKLHLVPFGEYLPFSRFYPFIRDMLGLADFTAGKELTLFPVSSHSERSEESKPAEILPPPGRGENDGVFSVLICFEDTVSYVSRRLVNHGAQFLINMTNDAWFLDTKAPFLHLQAAVFQSVENRRGLVRAANTGVSCFIDKFGRIYNFVQDSRGTKIFVVGQQMDEVFLNEPLTFYTKFGDIFTYLCFGCILVSCFFKWRART